MTPHRRALALASALLPLSLTLAAPAWASTTANEIVYVSDANNDGVYSLVLQDLETRTVTTLLPADTNQQFRYDDPELSPTGDRVVVSSDYQGSASATAADAAGLIVLNRDGSGFRRLTTGTTSSSGTSSTVTVDSFPAWSPDGNTIVFTRVTDTTDGTTDTTSTALFTIPAAGGTATPVPGGEHGFTADFNPQNGNEIVFAEPTDPSTGVGPLEVMNTDGTAKRALGATGALPAWSPDGGTIAYAAITDPSSTGADVAQIETVPAAGGTPTVFAVTRPSSARSVAEYPSWTPDGESILYDFYTYDSSSQPQQGDLWAVDRFGVRAGKFLGGAGDEAQVFAQGPAPTSVQPGSASRYTPVNPKRILDTRDGTGAAQAKVGPGQTIDLQVAGVQTDGGAVPANATAAILNVTVTDTTANTDVRVFPTGAPLPGSSNLNAGKSQTVPNLVTATLGTDGKVSIYNSGGTVDLIADLAGWYTPGTGAGFTAVDPRRILDTRPAPDGPVGTAGGPVAAGAPIDLQVTGTLPTAGGGSVTIPGDATAVVLNVTATSASTSTDVRVYPTPTDGSFPVVSNLNLGRSQTTPNLVTVAVGAGGKVRFRNASGSVQLLADIAGYYSASSAGSYVPVVPLRFLDTRSGVGAAPITIPDAGYDDLKVAGTRGVPAGALAAVLNLTATSVSNLADVRAYPKPTDGSVPVVSNLNPAKGATRANLAIVKPGDDGRVRLRVAGGSLHLIGDLAGYFM